VLKYGAPCVRALATRSVPARMLKTALLFDLEALRSSLLRGRHARSR
jgi:hypothetical protein